MKRRIVRMLLLGAVAFQCFLTLEVLTREKAASCPIGLGYHSVISGCTGECATDSDCTCCSSGELAL
jgi:hypothetical protein